MPEHLSHAALLSLRLPSPWYLSGEDNLRVTSFGALASVVLSVEGRYLPAAREGEDWSARPQSFAEAHTPNSDRTSASSIFRLGDGWLLNLQVRASTGSPRVGQVFVLVEIVRGLRGNVVPLATLLQGYVTDTSRLSSPGSPIRSSIEGPGVVRSITGTDPAANTEVSETVPTNARWRPLAIQFDLVTDANAANREVSLLLDDGTTVFARVPVGTNHAASLTRTYSFADHLPRNTIAQDAVLNAPLPRLALMGGFRLRTVTTNLQVGDNFGAPQLLVEEWIED